MTTVQVTVLKHHVKADGTCPIKFKIIHNGTSAYISSGISTERVKFKRNKSSGVVNDPDIVSLLEDKLSKIRTVLFKNENVISRLNSAKEIKEFLESYVTKKSQFEFFTFYNKYIKDIDKQSTKAYHITRMNAFKDFIEEETGTNFSNSKTDPILAVTGVNPG